jgi:hypothetical protein
LAADLFRANRPSWEQRHKGNQQRGYEDDGKSRRSNIYDLITTHAPTPPVAKSISCADDLRPLTDENIT